jgi:hypothetical protein
LENFVLRCDQWVPLAQISSSDAEIVGFDCFLHVRAWLNRDLARPAVQRGLEVTAV